MGLMRNRVALVTGASRGIGAATAKLLGQHGTAVGVNFHGNLAAAQSVVEAIEAEGGKAIPVQADVKDEAQLEKIVQQVSEVFGPIDTLVLNASASFVTAPFLEYQWSDFETKVLSELKSVFYPIKAVVRSMVEKQQGCIIAVSSMASRYPSEGLCAHSTAKSGLDAFVKSLALELGPHGIRVNVVAPGWIATDQTASQPQEFKDMMRKMTPLQRNGLPEDVAGSILMLASDAARFITGAYIPVCGGAQML
jgi:3-oxoacyl-[acyl-carrier protein] reductase